MFVSVYQCRPIHSVLFEIQGSKSSTTTLLNKARRQGIVETNNLINLGHTTYNNSPHQHYIYLDHGISTVGSSSQVLVPLTEARSQPRQDGTNRC